MNKHAFPHEYAYTRLGISQIQGVGVFAIRNIPSGTNIFFDDRTEMMWFGKNDIELAATDPALLRLYKDFCVLNDGMYGCPANFNSMTIGWYMNEPAKGTRPNVRIGTNFDFVAERDISAGEELTTVYNTFSEPIDRY